MNERLRVSARTPMPAAKRRERIARADQHLAGLERHLHELRKPAEAAAVATAREMLAGRWP